MLETTREIVANATTTITDQESAKSNNVQKSTIFRWINSFVTSPTSSTPDLKSDQKQKNYKSDSIINEYKGVQNLRQFWDNRVCSSSSHTSSNKKDIKQKSATLAGFYMKNNVNNLTKSNLSGSKSTSCLLSNKNQITNYQLEEEEEENLKILSKKIHDRKELDNFYKYKTAATRLSLSPLKESTKHKKNTSSNSGSSSTQGKVKIQKITSYGANFPLIAATETGEKIHWAKREDIIYNNSKQKQNTGIIDTGLTPTTPEAAGIKATKTISTIKVKKLKTSQLVPDPESIILSGGVGCGAGVISSNNKNKRNSINNNKEKEQFYNNSSEEETTTGSEMAIKSSPTTATSDEILTKKTPPTPKTYDKKTDMNINNYNNGGGRSHNGSLNSLSSESPVRKRISTPRKFSFKTHAKNYYAPRKMPNNGGGSNCSKVAALTHQFNQMIQKDAALLEEIKKKNGVLMMRAGHVYKIKPESEIVRRKLSKRNSSNNNNNNEDYIGSGKNTGKKRFSSRKHINLIRNSENINLSTEMHGPGKVKATIEKFETKDDKKDEVSKAPPRVMSPSGKGIPKPEVPSKSEQVLKRTKEIAIRNSLRRLKNSSLDRNGSVVNKILEEIQEETKTVSSVSRENISIKDKNNEEIIMTDLRMKSNDSGIEIPSIKIEEEKTDDEVPEKLKSQTQNDGKTEILAIESEIQIDGRIEDPQKKKSRYYRLYEKFLFRSSSSSSSSSNSSLSKKLPSSNNEQPSMGTTEELGDQKILNALQTVNKKLDHLSKSTGDVRLNDEKDNGSIHEDAPPKMTPNESFLFRQNSSYKKFCFSDAETDNDIGGTQKLVEAVNIRLVNKTQSMDEIRIPSIQIRQISLEEERKYPNILKKTDELLSKRCEDSKTEEGFYEPIEMYSHDSNESQQQQQQQQQNQGLEAIVQPSFIFKSQSIEEKHKEPDHDPNDYIYQSILEIKERQRRNSINSYESFDNYESVPDDCCHDEHKKLACSDSELEENGYEICDPPEPPPPRKSEQLADFIRNTSDQLPALPSPKRNIPTMNLLEVENRIAPPRPPKSPQIIRPKLSDIPPLVRDHKSLNCDEDEDEDEKSPYDEENIYDTIKSSESASHCYEILNNNRNPKSLDTTSITSNCYESINSLRQTITGLRHSDSVSTLSSEQKTNSLYGMTLGQNSSPPNEISSDNSDDWIDISDGEEDETHKKNHFVVVRERAKIHRSPVWSKKVRDRRNHQSAKNQEDDSNHYYEPLFVLQQNNLNESAIFSKSDNETGAGRRGLPPPLIMPDNSSYQQAIDEHFYSDDYDSFDSDEDTDEDVKKHDSGVDISNAKLPDPPSSTNQVYALVKKFKNFISIRKTSTTSSSPKTPDSKSYENTQFYVSAEEEYQNISLGDSSQKSQKSGKVKTPKAIKKTQKQISSASDDPYENTEFHTPITPKINLNDGGGTPISTISPSSKSDTNDFEKSETSTPFDLSSRKKSKSGKNFKSKFRKSLPNSEIGSGGGTRSTFYLSDSVDMDSGIFEKHSQVDASASSMKISEPNNTLAFEKSATVEKRKKKNRSPEFNRRKTTMGIRPTNPPPPPPPLDKKVQKKRASTTSWYAECGVFKPSPSTNNYNNNNEDVSLRDGKKDRNSNTSWYAEAGLYQTSGASVASSSGSSGVSTGGEGCPGDDNSHSMFSNEPLYQIYSAAKLESISRDMEDGDSTDGYEEIGLHSKTDENKKLPRPSALQLVGPKQGPSRTLWSEIPEVINSEILSTLTPTERRLQEAKFEILTSEASYLKSLNLLRSHFMNHPAFRDTNILNSTDRKTLFSHIVPVHECSDRLLSDLESCWQDNIMLLGLSKSLYKHADKYFHVYIKFCEHQGKMDRTLRRLKEAKGNFSQTLEILEIDPVCCGLNLHSFLMLPMQRITRLPLLIDAVFSKLQLDDDEYKDWKMTLGVLNKIVAQCNEAANRCEQAYEIERISKQIEFPCNIRSIAIAPVGVPALGTKPRSLVKKGELVHLIWRGDDAKLTFGKKFAKCNIFAFLFSDLLVLTKRKGEEQFLVFDYCPRSMLTVSSGEIIPQLPTKELTQAGKNLLLMTLLENHEGKTIEMLISCPSISEQQRWLQATAPPEPENPGEKLYEQWDCPQVIAKHEFCATEPDLLSLEPGDIVNVSRKMTDGWYEGERIRDGAKGWFPGNYTDEVNSPHVRARNLKQRYRLLTLTASYLESQTRKT